jgi:hypothetical protein
MTICQQCLGAKATQGTEDMINEGTGAAVVTMPSVGATPCTQCNGVGYY